MGVKACEIDGYKLWYFGSTRARNGVCILVERELVDRVVEVICKSERIMAIRLVVGGRGSQRDLWLRTTGRADR